MKKLLLAISIILFGALNCKSQISTKATTAIDAAKTLSNTLITVKDTVVKKSQSVLPSKIKTAKKPKKNKGKTPSKAIIHSAPNQVQLDSIKKIKTQGKLK